MQFAKNKMKHQKIKHVDGHSDLRRSILWTNESIMDTKTLVTESYQETSMPGIPENLLIVAGQSKKILKACQGYSLSYYMLFKKMQVSRV